MKNGQSLLLFEDHSQAFTDNETIIPVYALLFGMTENSESKPKSFVLFLRNESQLEFQMKKHSNIKQKLKNFSFQFFQRYCYKTQST
jgi:hypothetical protein